MLYNTVADTVGLGLLHAWLLRPSRVFMWYKTCQCLASLIDTIRISYQSRTYRQGKFGMCRVR